MLEKIPDIKYQTARLINSRHSKSRTESNEQIPLSIKLGIPALKFKNKSQPASPEVTNRIQNLMHSDRYKEVELFVTKRFTKDISHIHDSHKAPSTERGQEQKLSFLEPIQAETILPTSLDKLKCYINNSPVYNFAFQENKFNDSGSMKITKSLEKSPPSLGKPTGKQDIENLKRWLDFMQEKNIPNLPSVISQNESIEKDKEEIVETVYMAALKEIIRQVSVHCSLRGHLLKSTIEVLSFLWKSSANTLKKQIETERSLFSKKLSDLHYKAAKRKAKLQVKLKASQKENDDLQKRQNSLEEEISQLNKFISRFKNELVRKQEQMLSSKRKLLLSQDSMHERNFMNRILQEDVKRISVHCTQTDPELVKKNETKEKATETDDIEKISEQVKNIENKAKEDFYNDIPKIQIIGEIENPSILSSMSNDSSFDLDSSEEKSVHDIETQEAENLTSNNIENSQENHVSIHDENEGKNEENWKEPLFIDQSVQWEEIPDEYEEEIAEIENENSIMSNGPEENSVSSEELASDTEEMNKKNIGEYSPIADKDISGTLDKLDFFQGLSSSNLICKEAPEGIDQEVWKEGYKAGFEACLKQKNTDLYCDSKTQLSSIPDDNLPKPTFSTQHLGDEFSMPTNEIFESRAKSQRKPSRKKETRFVEFQVGKREVRTQSVRKASESTQIFKKFIIKDFEKIKKFANMARKVLLRTIFTIFNGASKMVNNEGFDLLEYIYEELLFKFSMKQITERKVKEILASSLVYKHLARAKLLIKCLGAGNQSGLKEYSKETVIFCLEAYYFMLNKQIGIITGNDDTGEPTFYPKARADECIKEKLEPILSRINLQKVFAAAEKISVKDPKKINKNVLDLDEFIYILCEAYEQYREEIIQGVSLAISPILKNDCLSKTELYMIIRSIMPHKLTLLKLEDIAIWNSSKILNLCMKKGILNINEVNYFINEVSWAFGSDENMIEKIEEFIQKINIDIIAKANNLSIEEWREKIREYKNTNNRFLLHLLIEEAKYLSYISGMHLFEG